MERDEQDAFERLLTWTVFAGAAVACSQWTVPGLGERLAIADVLMALAFGLALWRCVRRRETVPASGLLVAFLGVYGCAAVATSSGMGGALEAVQKTAHILGGFTVFSVALRHAHLRRALFGGVLLGLVGNTAAAWGQWMSHGYGTAVTGLTGSRMACSFVLALLLCWLQPSLWRWAGGDRGRLSAVALGTTAVLASVGHGQMLVLAIAGVLVAGALAGGGRRLALNAVVGLLVLGSLWLGSGTRPEALRESLNPRRDGRWKQAHTELVAAARMALDHPLAGVGPRRYQERVGTYYGDLYNPNYNEVERDTQSGWGILASTVGLPGCVLLAAAIIAGVGSAAGRLRGARTVLSDLDAGAVAAGGVLVLGMFISDAFVRGLGWTVALVLASGISLGTRHLNLRWQRFVVMAAVVGGLSVASVLRRGGELPASPSVGRGAAAQSHAFADAFFRVLEAGDAANVAPPMKIGTDASGRTVLEIPDNSCNIPEGFQPDLTYGGAEFDLELEVPLSGRVWVRVWWAGSCGNSLFMQLDDAAPVAVGNDGTYERWHWLPVPGTLQLAPGKHRLRILNREDGMALDQILIAGDAQYVPQGIEVE